MKTSGTLGRSLNAPEPAQDIDGENGNARSGGNAGERLLCAGFAMGEPVAADHDCNQTCNLRNRAGEKALDGGKAGVERTSLGVSCDRYKQQKGKEGKFR